MEDIIVIVLQFLIEFIFNVLLNVPFDLPSGSRKTPEKTGIAGGCFLWWVGGSALAYGSLQAFSYTLIRVAALRIANLVLAPVAAAYLSQALAKTRAKTNANILPRNHFWRAFWFTLGYVTVRFAYAKRF
jgi:hypothetical protein